MLHSEVNQLRKENQSLRENIKLKPIEDLEEVEKQNSLLQEQLRNLLKNQTNFQQTSIISKPEEVSLKNAIVIMYIKTNFEI